MSSVLVLNSTGCVNEVGHHQSSASAASVSSYDCTFLEDN